MLEFKQICLEDRNWINPILKESNFMGCEYNFANNLAWQTWGKSEICHYKNFYISKFGIEKPTFNFPSGSGDYLDLLNQLKDYCRSINVPLVLTGACNHAVERLVEYNLYEFTVHKDESAFDYIYNSIDLIELKGKKYHSKRNHISKFLENNWSFEPMTTDNIPDCRAFSRLMFSQNESYTDRSGRAEQRAIDIYFDNFEILELKGGLLKVDEKIIGFTIGEQINTDTFCVHIEKADSDIQGSFAMLNNQFAKMYANDLKYINREEDLGIEGLRKSKHSYHPVFLLEKCVITFK